LAYNFFSLFGVGSATISELELLAPKQFEHLIALFHFTTKIAGFVYGSMACDTSCLPRLIMSNQRSEIGEDKTGISGCCCCCCCSVLHLVA